MEKIRHKINIDSIFVFTFVLISFFGDGLKNDWLFLSFSLLSFAFFVYKKVKIEGNDLWLFFLISISVSTFFSHAPIISFFILFKWFVYWLFYRYALYNHNTEISFILSIILISFISSIMIIKSQFSPVSGSLGIISGNINYTSVFFVLVALYFLYSAINSSAKLKIINLIAMTYFIAFILLVNSRGAFLSFLCSAFFILFRFEKRKAIIYWILILLIIFSFLPSDFLSHLFKIEESYSYTRIKLWKTALIGFLNFPIFGYGPGLFENIFSIFKFRNFDGFAFYNHTTIHSHSEILNILSESGIVAGVFYILAFLYSFYKAKDKIFRFFMLAIFIQSSVDVIFYLPLIAIIFMMSIGYSNQNSSDNDLNLIGSRLKTSIFIALAMTAVLPYFNYKISLKSISAENSHKSFESVNIDDHNLRNEILFSLPNSVRIFALSSYGLNYYPLSVYFLFEKSKCLILAGDYSGAIENLKKAIFLEPGFNKAYLMLAEIYLKQGDKRKAREALKNLKFYYNKKDRQYGFYVAYLRDFDIKTYKKLKSLVK